MQVVNHCYVSYLLESAGTQPRLEQIMDKEDKARAWHEVVLTFDILISAILIAGAIVFAAMWDGRRMDDAELQKKERMSRVQFVDQMRSAFQGKWKLHGQEHTLRDVKITDIRFSSKQDQILIECVLLCDTPGEIPV